MSRFPIWFTVAIGVAALFFLAVPFGPGTSTGARAFFSILMGGLITGGAAVILSFLRDLAGLARRCAAPQPPIVPRAPPPDLSPARKAAVRKTVAVLAAHDLFAPETPDPALFFPGVADMDESVKPDTVLAALGELDHYHPGTDPARFMANLAMLDAKTEQDPDYLRGQIADLERLADGALRISDVVIDAVWPPAERIMPVRISLTVNGAPLTIAYDGDVKYASSHIQHALALHLDAAKAGRRFAWLWTDQGAWIAALPDGAVEALNAALKLKPQGRCVWEWVSDAKPFAAGDTP
ncbi:hypothetical protein ASD67_07690 [Sphingopyxis sp. Root1497]|uniref:hypothetical protein n=1 Tax=Sphingopyxis sp. Root1497 TaxID=1736474 RepID=UPI0006F8F806|nr:hypothetical protein [Sphingopyxis sp. Root1497]KQZ64361.1 hypothetical protein ASD67_07690 [Sphingopyxis sp. Root1497]